jgi:hypothetical protein
MKIPPLGTVVLFIADGGMEEWTDGRTDGRTDRRRDMTKLIFAFRNFANALHMDVAKREFCLTHV